VPYIDISSKVELIPLLKKFRFLVNITCPSTPPSLIVLLKIVEIVLMRKLTL